MCIWFRETMEIFLCLLLASSVAARIPTSLFSNVQLQRGRCPRIATVPDFDPELVIVCTCASFSIVCYTTVQLILFCLQYLGDWYTQYTTPAFFQPSGSKCIRASYSNRGNGTISVYNTGTRPNGVVDEICGYAYQRDAENHPGELKVRFPLVPVAGDYMVLDTDYGSFTSVYSCRSVLFFFKVEVGWVLTRDRLASNRTVKCIINSVDLSFDLTLTATM